MDAIAVYSFECMCFNSGDIVTGQYQIIRKLGSGGFGITYLAQDNHQPTIADPVVIKQIPLLQAENKEVKSTNYLDRLEREANTLWKLEHPCIPQFLAKFIDGAYFYIVQEYIDGHDLSQEIVPGEPIKETQAFAMLKEILEILQFVHKQNIIHRDIKPANMIRRQCDRKLVLIDFGAVKEDATRHTHASGVCITQAISTRGYTPAEQLAGMPRLNSDIYAVGIMMMQAVTGFSIKAICDREQIPLRDRNCQYLWQDYAPQISPNLRKIISRMIKYSFKNRYQSVEEILEALTPRSFKGLENDVNPHASTLKYSPLPNFYYQYKHRLNFSALAIISSIFIFFVFYQSNACSANTGDFISCGEELLDPLSKGSIKFNAAKNYQNKDYQKALSYYQESWQKENLDAESSIYLNNAFIEANNADYYTIAVAAPLDSGNTIKSSSIAQDFLRGIAQAQTEVNLSLIPSYKSGTQLLPGQHFLKSRPISNQPVKGLKIVIIDDGNKPEQAQVAAQAIAEDKNILGVIGHYASQITLATVDIYDQENLAQISYGTTTQELTQNPKNNFFRVVYTNQEEAEAIVRYIEKVDYSNKKIAIFYNPNSDYSNRFKIAIQNKLNKLNLPNVKIVKEFDFADEQNFRTELALAEAAKLEANIFILLPDGQVTNSFAKALEVLEYDNGNNLMLGGNPLINPKVTNHRATQSLNLIVSTFWHPSANLESEFSRQAERLWNSSINGGTAMAYDATLTMIEAIKQQKIPTRKGTIERLRAADFVVPQGATGEITFNTPENGDRAKYHPTLVRLFDCGESNHFIHLSIDNQDAANLLCQTK